jgi:hypothetical protein
VLLVAKGAHEFNEIPTKSTSVTAEVAGSSPVVPAINQRKYKVYGTVTRLVVTREGAEGC